MIALAAPMVKAMIHWCRSYIPWPAAAPPWSWRCAARASTSASRYDSLLTSSLALKMKASGQHRCMLGEVEDMMEDPDTSSCAITPNGSSGRQKVVNSCRLATVGGAV